MAGEQTDKLDDFEAAFSLITDADSKGTTAEIKSAVEVPAKTAEEIETERVAAEAAAATAAAEKETADALALANAGKTPEQIEEEAKAAEDAAKLVLDTKAAEDAAARTAAGNEALAATVAKAIRQTDQEAAAAEAERKRVAAVKPPELLTPEELVMVQQFEKDFPDVAKAQAIVRRAEYKQVAGHILGEVERYVGEKLGPIATLLANLAERTHVGDLQKEVPDYDKLDVPKLVAWVKTQPDYLQPAYDTVMKSGSSAQVKDLVARFYSDTGVKPAATAPVVKTAEEIAAAATAAAARTKAVAALAPVVAKRAGAVAAAAPTDFEGGFDAALRELAATDADRFTR